VQAFVVTAGLCLGLDLMHRSPFEPEATEHHRLIEKTINILAGWPTSIVAGHGIRLLTSLLQESAKKQDGSNRTSNDEPHVDFPCNIAPQALAESAQETTPAMTNESTIAETADENENLWGIEFDTEMLGFEDLMNTLPLQASLDNSMFLDSIMPNYNNSFY
jgi:hypothetical protein